MKFSSLGAYVVLPFGKLDAYARYRRRAMDVVSCSLCHSHKPWFPVAVITSCSTYMLHAYDSSQAVVTISE